MDTKLNIASCKETNTEQVPGMAYVPWQQFTRTYDPNRALRAGTIFRNLISRLLEIVHGTMEVDADEQTKSGYAAKENEPEGTV